jgi:hypothetical protein
MGGQMTTPPSETEPPVPPDSIKTHSLEEVAAKHLPAELKNPVRWLAMRLNRGELRGVRMGRYWRMRDADITFMLDLYSNAANVAAKPTPEPASSPADSIIDGLSPRARRRVRIVR